MRALLSVYDKTGVVEFAEQLHGLGIELISSGGTAKAIRDGRPHIPVLDVADFTGYPAMLGHRVVTLHPKVHGGILADRDDPEHQADLATYEIPTIDLVVANLYPFASEPSIELIDIGGPAMVRASAKNHAHVGILVDPTDYVAVLDELRQNGELSADLRRRLARKAFAHTAAYDAQIVNWFDEVDASDRESAGLEPELPPTLHIAARLRDMARYGENPHQLGARYSVDGAHSWWDDKEQLQGKAMSLLNFRDADAAWTQAWAFGDEPTAVVIKHANPCGVAVASSIEEAYRLANACDKTSAFGGIVAINRDMTAELAAMLVEIFTEVVIAENYSPEALEILKQKKDLRVLRASTPSQPRLHVQQIDGGNSLLVQTPDTFLTTRKDWTVATDREPTEAEWVDLELAWKVAAKVTSNTIVLVKNGQAVGIGAGQQNRRDSGVIAAQKADGRAVGGACASDAFFPFADGLQAAIDAGATAVIQPGGSIRDQEVIDAANEAGLAMVFTSKRHFRH